MSRYSKAVLTVIAACLVYLCLRDLPVWPLATAAGRGGRDVHVRTLTAQSIAIMRDGVARGGMTCLRDGSVCFALHDGDGNPNLVLNVAKSGEPTVLLRQGKDVLARLP